MLRWNPAAKIMGPIVLFTAVTGCTKHTIDVQPIRVEPIHMTVDINIKVDRELDEFFDFEDEIVVPVVPGSTTQPAVNDGGTQ